MKLLLILVIAFSFTYCGTQNSDTKEKKSTNQENPSAEGNNEEESSETTENDNEKETTENDGNSSNWEGTIAGQKIQMYIGKERDAGGNGRTSLADGWYYYESQGVDNKIIIQKMSTVGNLQHEGAGTSISEFDKSGKVQATFIISEVKQKSMSGTWENLKNGKKFDFTLSQK